MITKSRIVTIKQIPDRNVRRGKADDPEFYHKKVGGSLNGANCLTEEEKRFLLPELIRSHPNNQEWNKEVKLYFDNISKEIPFLGVELETGFIYDKEKDAEEDKRKVGEGCKPINPADFVFYKYCLGYSRIANRYEDINKSFNIDFYIEDKATLIKRDKDRSVENMKANRYALELIDDVQKADNVLLIYGYAPEFMSSDEKYPIIEGLAKADSREKDPENTKVKKFIKVNEDEELLMKAFVQRCLNAKVLYQLPNTDTIMFDVPNGSSIRVGLSTEDAITYLTRAENRDTYTKVLTNLDFVNQQSGVKYNAPGQNEKEVTEKKETKVEEKKEVKAETKKEEAKTEIKEPAKA